MPAISSFFYQIVIYYFGNKIHLLVIPSKEGIQAFDPVGGRPGCPLEFIPHLMRDGHDNKDFRKTDWDY